MSNYDLIYKDLVNEILEIGYWDTGENVRTVYADGNPAYTKSIIGKQIILDNADVPILTTKRVAWKSAIHELLWFYVHRTSDTTYLKENNVKIWDEWTREDNTIGRAYGHQLGKSIKTGEWERNPISGHLHPVMTNQVENLINGLKNNPSSRRHIISLWNIDDMWDMSLQPCVWNNQCIVQDGKLHLIVNVRSNDIALGNPFNLFQYYVLQRMLAQVSNLELGTLRFNINHAHIYDRHIDTIAEQVTREPFVAPELWINPEVKNFDDFTIDDFKLIGYNHRGNVSYEVAI